MGLLVFIFTSHYSFQNPFTRSKQMLRKITLFSSLLLSASLLAMPMTANADLTIVNNTDSDSTCIVNDGMCSNELGDQGITHAHTSNLILQIELYIACGSNTSNCKADVYMSSNCSGPKVGTVILDINQGISQLTSTGAYKITSADPFQVQIDLA
jgi:hypothetical protein